MTPEQAQELLLRVSQLEERLNRYEKPDKYIFEKSVQILEGRNFQLGRTAGTQFGTDTDQKIGFFGATPVGPYNIPFPVAAADLYTALNRLGFVYHA
ncbi:hypothetical protein UNPF46_08560 [Bradyrhizobium sp. UNPF46]|uniref:hypothetical protein n=1 Tax=Bradyrhizobium sp. UNPF46 TaxID=1141168 RepID=UPI00114E4763|nr:hypothetical protein [Bradyrhizobium sp. UNPF46]TQF41162.1 hypothetical protein UNPF46_08560 [Bradyrhizobium sp. UNPF46]